MLRFNLFLLLILHLNSGMDLNSLENRANRGGCTFNRGRGGWFGGRFKVQQVMLLVCAIIGTHLWCLQPGMHLNNGMELPHLTGISGQIAKINGCLTLISGKLHLHEDRHLVLSLDLLSPLNIVNLKLILQALILIITTHLFNLINTGIQTHEQHTMWLTILISYLMVLIF